jgi:TRAP-type C4-dicarboxylate transport system permease large subunit
MARLPGGAPMFLAVSVLAFMVLGSVLEGIPAIVLFGPLLFPIARAIGVHEVHYAMVVILSMGIGLFAPPLGVGYYAACAIGRVNPDEGIRPIVGYLLALPFVIRAAVVQGVATATEVSTIGIAYSVIAGLLVYRQFPWRRLGPMLVETASLSGAILLIIGCATAMAWGLTQSGFSRLLAQTMASLPGGATMFMAVSILAFVVLGSVLEGIPAIVLFGPLLFPIARQLGVHEVHYAMVVILSMGLGLFAPPLGVGYYAACAIGRVNPDEGIRPIMGYMLALLVGTVIVAFVPWISIGFL